jgi:uncharacterized repeat protein (TIGR03803 family)
MRDDLSNSPVIFAKRVVSVCAASALLGGCGGPHSAAPLPGQPAPASQSVRSGAGSGYDSLYSFKGGTDGAAPTASLTAAGGVLYGTTTEGGRTCDGVSVGCGTVFSVTTQGDESVIYAFRGSDSGCDGLGPTGTLVAVGGLLYGATPYGGCADGTVFSASTSGSEVVLHRFVSSRRGLIPFGGLTSVNAMLYGTATEGGNEPCKRFYAGCGTVFAMSSTGREQTLYAFKNAKDGVAPNGVVAIGKRFYGTTATGGGHDFGTVFAIDDSGTERVLYSFRGGNDGAYPQPGLTVVKGVLYGTTAQGGMSVGSYLAGAGTVFSVTPGGKEKVVYRFGVSGDGIAPNGALALVNGTLYGTTQFGGTHVCYYFQGCGTVFEVQPSGEEQVIYDFAGPPDGYGPSAGVTLFRGKLYGTTYYGGTETLYGRCCGTIFELSP